MLAGTGGCAVAEASVARLVAGAVFIKAGGMDAPQCWRGLSAIWVCLLSLARSCATGLVPVGCKTGVDWPVYGGGGTDCCPQWIFKSPTEQSWAIH